MLISKSITFNTPPQTRVFIPLMDTKLLLLLILLTYTHERSKLLKQHIRLVHISTILEMTPRRLLLNKLQTQHYHLKMILYAFLESLLLRMLPCSLLRTPHLRLNIALSILAVLRMWLTIDLHSPHTLQIRLFPISTWVQIPLPPLLGAVMSDWIYACLMGPLSIMSCEERTACPWCALSATVCVCDV